MLSFGDEHTEKLYLTRCFFLPTLSRQEPEREIFVLKMPPTSMFVSVWKYRGFIISSIKREFQLKYINSLLGSAWVVLNPLAMIIVYTMIFSHVMRAKLSTSINSYTYSIYLCTGILTWGLFTEIAIRAQGMFLENANILKKINFPRLCLPIIIVCSSILNFSIIFFLFIVFLLFSGNFPGWSFLALLPILVIQIAFSIGLGIVLGVINVFFRDVGQFFSFFLQFWFWLTPIVYPISILPVKLRPLIEFNPMAIFVSAYQTIIVSGNFPNWSSILLVAVLAVALCILAVRTLSKHAGEIVDEL